MKNSEDLVLFVLGVLAIGLTTLLLFSLGSNVGSQVEKLVYMPVEQAEIAAQPQYCEPKGADIFDLEVEETLKKAAAYLGNGKFVEKEHAALLQRLEFYCDLSSIRQDRRETARGLIDDMNHLQSVARKVKLKEQINAAVTDAETHLATGKRDESEAKRIMNRIESIYAISGLTEDQNRSLKTTLSALKDAYKPPEKKVARAPAPKPKPEPKSEPKPEPEPAPKVQAVTIQPQHAVKQESQVVLEKYTSAMSRFKAYWSEKKYRQEYHHELTDELKEISKKSDLLSRVQKDDLEEAIDNMKRIDTKFGTKKQEKLRSFR